VDSSCTNKWEKFYKLKLPELINGLFCESNPIPIKYLLFSTKIFTHNVLRLPMTSLDVKYHSKIENSLENTLKVYGK
jgi:dihydrodipicolinate synthase/N-acetylneuraminate lyase